MSIEINSKFKRAIDLIDGGKDIFVTGRAGTGKSTLLQYLRKITSKKVVVLAPTGVSALNVQGQTIHSFFRFKPGITLDNVKRIVKRDSTNIYKQLDAIIIDEVSMVRADLMDCIDKFMRINCNSALPFAGKQVVLFGDLYQLPPVINSQERKMFSSRYKTGYFFSSRVMETLPIEIVELDKIYRQKNEEFIGILNGIRNNSVTEPMLEKLNSRHDPFFEPDEKSFFVYLTTRNLQAVRVNEIKLNKTAGTEYLFKAQITGNFNKASYPTEEVLKIKEGAQIMLLNNDSKKRWVNGSIGKVDKIDTDKEIIAATLSDNTKVDITAHTWDLFHYFFNEETQEVETEETGSFTQMPLRLSWAVTIHKAQGKTFDNVILDIGEGAFSPGQVYVGLSRCVSLEGLILKKKIQKRHIFMDRNVVNFMTGYRYAISEKKMSIEDKTKFIQGVIKRRGKLKIVYLKNNDEESCRIIWPEHVGRLEYMGKIFTGMRAFCCNREDARIFRVDRILEMDELKDGDIKH